MITVYIWEFRGSHVAWGHASMQIDKTYISWWPEPNEGDNRVPKVSLISEIYSVSPIRNRQFSDDISREKGEGAPPDHSISFNGLDEKAIKDWWQSFGLTRDGQLYYGPLLPWETLKQNCSTVVATGLRIGGGDHYASWDTTWNVVWNPNSILKYARSIKTGLMSRNMDGVVKHAIAEGKTDPNYDAAQRIVNPSKKF